MALVPPEKDVAAPGLDVAGIGQDWTKPKGPPERLTLGDVKFSQAKGGRFFQAKETTRFQSTALRKNLAAVQERAMGEGRAAVNRLQAALSAVISTS